MSVDAGVPGRAREVFVLPVGDVDVGPRVPVLFRKTEINYVHQVAFLAKTPENWRFQLNQEFLNTSLELGRGSKPRELEFFPRVFGNFNHKKCFPFFPQKSSIL